MQKRAAPGAAKLLHERSALSRVPMRLKVRMGSSPRDDRANEKEQTSDTVARKTGTSGPVNRRTLNKEDYVSQPLTLYYVGSASSCFLT
jgi:hypothetical protein